MELIDIARIIFALIAVIGMIGLAAVAARKLGLGSGALSFVKARRLALIETLSLDQKRRAAIIACDGREHLVILDPARVTVVERGIPGRETAPEADPFEAIAAAPARRMQLAPPVVSLFNRAPIDQAGKLRAAGLL
jgi:flagellar protein FliO/FliZ